jgi:DNA-binding CsgD family transcriptional regulator
MRSEDEDEALALLAKGLTTRSDANRARTLVAMALCRLSGAEGANLLLGRHYLSPGPDLRSAANYGVHRHKTSWIVAGQSRYKPRNPLLPFLPRIEGPVYVATDVLGTLRWRASEYVVDYLKPIATTNVAGMTLRGRDGAIFGGIFFGHADPKGFSRRGLSRLRSVAASVAHGLSDIAEWEAWQSRQADALEPLLGAMSDPMIVIERVSSGKGRLVSASPTAARILLLDRRGERHNPELAALVAASLAAAPPGEQPVTWTARDGTPFELKAAAVPSFGGSTLVVRLVSPAPASPEPRVWTRARAAGLTAREADILDALARGLSHKQIAWELGIRYFTVTTHTRNLFAKLGVSGRMEALNAVTRRADARSRDPAS